MSRELNKSHIGKIIEVSDSVESAPCQREFLGFFGHKIMCRVSTSSTRVYGWAHGHPIQTKAEKFMVEWEGKKICQTGWLTSDYYVVPNTIDDNDDVWGDDENGFSVPITTGATWQLWTPPEPKVVLDTRRVAGWFCADPNYEFMLFPICSTDGRFIIIRGQRYSIDGTGIKDLLFSKDPMKPISQWQSLEEVCCGA